MSKNTLRQPNLEDQGNRRMREEKENCKLGEMKCGTDSVYSTPITVIGCVQLTPYRHHGASAFCTPHDATL